MSDVGLPRDQIIAYLRALADRIECDEKIKLTVLVDAKGISGLANFGHAHIGELFLQLDDNAFKQRLAFLMPQLLPHVQALIEAQRSTAGSTH